MTPKIDFLSVVYLVGAAQGAFLIVALLDNKLGNHQANRYLAAFLSVFTLALVFEFFYQSRYLYQYPHLTGLNWPLDFLYGPLFYLYIRRLTEAKPPAAQNRDFRHFILFPIGIALALPTWLLEPGDKILMNYPLDGLPNAAVFRANLFDGVASLLSVIQMAVYLRFSQMALGRHRENIQQQFSAIEEINLSWLTTLLRILITLWVLYIVHIFFSEALGIDDNALAALFLVLVMTIYGLGYRGLRQPTIFKQPEPFSSPPEKEKYSKSKLGEEETRTIKARLFEAVEKYQPHLDGGVTLPQLAQLIDCSSNQLSQLINDELGVSFFDFINGYRIERAKHLLLNDPKMPILTVAMEAGFNSKSAFYTAFKKELGITPSQYRRTGEKANVAK